MEKDPFKEYLKESEPGKAGKGYAWSTAIGLQAVDGLRPSQYLIDHNRNLHISGLWRIEKADIESVLSEKAKDFSAKTMPHIHRLFDKFGFEEVFGRSAVMELLGLKGSGASKLISNLARADMIEPVSGHGKGRYKFKR